jgi:hypothetical protein
MPRRDYRKTRAQLFRVIPSHLLWAVVLGLPAGLLLYFLKDWQLDGPWALLTFIPIAAIYVNAAALPAAIPGRYWSFGYIGAMMLFLLLIAGSVVSNWYSFPHSRLFSGTEIERVYVGVNIVTYWAILTGVLLGLLYGLMAGRTASLVLSAVFGALAGFSLGLMLPHFYPQLNAGAVASAGGSMSEISFPQSLPLFTALFAAGIVALHLACLMGAALGANSGADAGGKSDTVVK